MEESTTARYPAFRSTKLNLYEHYNMLPPGNFMNKGYQNRYIKYILLAS